MSAEPTVERRGDGLVIRIPMELKRRGGRKEIIAPEGLRRRGSRAQEPLVTALARALHWQELADSRFRSITELAEALDVDRSYVGRILRLATPASDIVEAIVDGREPSGLSLGRLVKEMPLVWAEQRERLGLSGR